jgi:hypothetical protein
MVGLSPNKAAAILRSDHTGTPPWSLMVVNAAPAIVSDDMAIQLRTRDGVAYVSRARRKSETQTRVRTTLLEGTEPLVVISRPIN